MGSWLYADQPIIVEVTAFVRDEGSVIVLEGVDHGGRAVIRFAADHRPGRAIVEALASEEPVVVEVERWQVLERSPRLYRLLGG